MKTIIYSANREYDLRELLKKVYPDADVYDDYSPVTGYEYFVCNPSYGSTLYAYRIRHINGKVQAEFVFSGTLAEWDLFLDPDFDFSDIEL